MDLTSSLITLIVAILGIYVVTLVIKNWHNLPLVLLPFIWYLPEQTSPGRLLETQMYLRWFSVILIPVLIILLLLRNQIFAERRIKINLSNISPYILIFIFLTALAAFVNKISINETIAYLAVYLRYPIFFIIMLNIPFNDKLVVRFLVLFLILTYIQVPEVLYRYFVFGITGDEISWSLGGWGTTNIGIYCIYCSSLIVAHGLNQRFSIWHLIGIFALFIPSILGEIKAATLWMPVIVILIIIFYLTTIKRGRLGIIAALVIIIIFSSLSLQWWQGLHGSNIQKIVEDIFLSFQGKVYGEERYSVYRVGVVLRVLEEVRKNSTNLWFGFGPGSSFVGNFWGRPGLIMQLEFSTKDTPNQFASSLLDIGIIGIIAYYLILLNFFILWKNIRKIKNHNDKLFNILATAYPGFLIYYSIVGPLYHPVWRFDASSFIFYFVSAYLYQKLNDYKQISVAKSNK